MKCAKCQSPLPVSAAFCPNCGTQPPAATGPKTFSGLNTVAPMRESSVSVLEPGTLFAGRYQVIRKIGEGGMGIVYVAKDTNTNEEIVLKLIHPNLVAGEEALNRLMSEGLTARQIRHPNIVAVYDVALSDGQAYFTMEFVKGGTLRSWMNNAKRSGREISVQTAAGLMKSMLSGVAEAHRLGFIHRDLKPENVLLSGEPDAGDFGLKILDFGIAKAVGAVSTYSGPVGTPPYMAPEQRTSSDTVGPAADFYSLTVMLYELLMEAAPEGRWELVSQSRRDVPKAIDGLIEKGLSTRPRSRFASATEFAAAVDAVGGNVQPGPHPPLPPPPPQPPPPPPPPGPSPWAALTSPAFFTNLPKRTKMWIGVGLAALVVIASIVENLPKPTPPGPETRLPAGETEGSREKGSVVAPTPPERELVQPQPDGLSELAGYWGGFGTRFMINYDGRQRFTGTAPGMTLEANISPGGQAQFTVRFANGASVQGSGQINPHSDGVHLDYRLADGNSGTFAINH